ncbi:hypothetical protein CEJ42_08695 [Herbaspirillum robiniae]|uniref:Uncharacterized protein n=1 Tax=Herbaspirillum robiniae TaxID=2014887 RepID=A0A2D0B6B6_9BURK|nr:hypothetical protein CEJ42_08695 [Herbaspirillum robiniae]
MVAMASRGDGRAGFPGAGGAPWTGLCNASKTRPVAPHAATPNMSFFGINGDAWLGLGEAVTQPA